MAEPLEIGPVVGMPGWLDEAVASGDVRYSVGGRPASDGDWADAVEASQSQAGEPGLKPAARAQHLQLRDVLDLATATWRAEGGTPYGERARGTAVALEWLIGDYVVAPLTGSYVVRPQFEDALAESLRGERLLAGSGEPVMGRHFVVGVCQACSVFMGRSGPFWWEERDAVG